MAMASYGVFPYFEFAAAADTASALIREKIDAVTPEIETVSARMAGDEEVGKEWGGKWDTAFNQFLPNACRLADAFGAIANRAYAAGVNFIAAEWVAAGKQGALPAPPTAPPQHVDQRVMLGNLPTSIGPNPEPLVTDIPGLTDAIAKDLPNGNDVKLDIVGDLLGDLATVIGEQNDAVRKFGREPGARDSRDAHLLYDEYVANVLAPGGMLKEDATTLANAATTFGQELVTQRRDMNTAIEELTMTAAVTLAVGAAGTVVTATGSNWVSLGVTAGRVTTTGLRIRSLVETLQTASRTIGTTLTTLRVTANISALMDETISKTLTNFEIDPDTGVIKMQPVFPKWKQEAWERYLADCGTRPSGCLSMEEWSKKYDQLMENTANGTEWDQEVGEILGYTKEDGWHPQRHVEGVDGRRYDFVHYNEDGEPDELVENKSGRLDGEQLVKDEQALDAGYKVTYNLKAPVSPSQQAELDRLKAEYGDQFTVNYHYK